MYARNTVCTRNKMIFRTVCDFFKFLLSALICCLCFSTNGQDTEPHNPSYYFDHIKIKNGLSQSSVYSIYQDGSGFIWLGTRDGLNRFDGLEFELFRHNVGDSTSISGNIINDIKEDADGNMWIATEDGISKYDPKQRVFRNYNLDSSIHAISAVDVIHITKGNTIWAGGKFGMLSFDPEKEIFYNSIFKEHSHDTGRRFSVNTIFEDGEENLWIGTSRSGIYLWNLSHGLLTPFNAEILEDNALRRIEALIVQDSVVWVGTYGNGLFKYGKDGQRLAHYHSKAINIRHKISNDNIRALQTDSLDLWVGTFNGLNIIKRTGDVATIKYERGNTKGLPHNSVRSLYKDQKGSMWIGTYFEGVSIFDKDNQRFQHFYQISGKKSSLSYDVVGAFCEGANGELFIGTERGGLNVYDSKSNTHSVITDTNFLESTIKSLCLAPDGEIWLGIFKKGLFHYDRKLKKLIQYPDESLSFHFLKAAIINCILPDGPNNLWIGTGNNGLQQFSLKNKQFVNFSYNERINNIIGNRSINAIALRDNKLFIATKGAGIICFDPKNGTINRQTRFLVDGEPLQINEFNHISWDNNGILWLSTNGEGLLAFDPVAETYKRWHVVSGLSSNIVLGILQDDKEFNWAITMTGISKLDFNTPEVLKNYSYISGFPLEENNEGAFFKNHVGEFLIGGSNGYVRFSPKEIASNKFSPRPVFTSLTVMNKEVRPKDATTILDREINKTSHITLNHNQSIFSIKFATLNFLHPENNQYAYKLEGFDEDWVYSKTRREVSYTNLPEGNYTLYVKSANNDGVWNEAPASLEIEISPPPWRTWWAYLIYTLLIVLGFYVIRYNAVRSTQLVNNLKIEQLEKEKWKEIHDLKLQYFIDVSHEFRTPLSLILGPLEDMVNRDGQDNWMRSRIKIMYFNTKRLLLLIDQILEIREVETGHSKLTKQPLLISYVLQGIVGSFKALADKNKIHLSLKLDLLNEVPILCDQNKLEKILFNLLSNAFKFTPEGGEISLIVSAKKEKDLIIHCIELSDTGAGISLNKLSKIFDRFYKSDQNSHGAGAGIGLSLTRSLTELMKGSITVDSKKNKGTTFTVTIPFKVAKAVSPKRKESLLFQKPIPLEYQNTPLVNQNKVHTVVKQETILIVEDNAEFRNYLKSQLEVFYKIIVAKDGAQGLQKVKKKGPDIVISDVMMPKMDGLELCRQIKNTKELCHIPIILLTAKSANPHKLEGLKYGADEYISKPFNLTELTTRIKNILYNRNLVQQKFKDNNVLITPIKIIVNSYDEKLMENFISIVKENIDKPNFTVDYIGNQIGLSRVHLSRKIKALTGMTPAGFIKDFRMKQALGMIKTDSFSVADIAYAVGYQDVQYFSKSFKLYFGKSPTQYIKESS